jgi:DNA repair photolyase
MTQPFEVLQNYQNDIGNLRSHHWKYWMDLYTNCYYDCAYCVYRAAGKMGRVEHHPQRIESLRADLSRMGPKGIVYLGPRADIYQPIERKQRLARRAFEAFVEANVPVFTVTRSELILHDLDVLKALAAKGLVEVSITVASPRVIARMEPHTLPVRDRFALIEELTRAGITVSLHMSPLLPGVDHVEDWEWLIEEATASGSSCAYACMLGMTSNYYQLMSDVVGQYDASSAAKFAIVYPQSPPPGKVSSAPGEFVLEAMQRLSAFSAQRGLPFACVHIPIYDTTERNGGIFRYKLPNVGDMVRHFNRLGQHRISLDTLLQYVRGFTAVDSNYISMVSGYWNDGVLFRNTYYHPVSISGERLYERQERLDLGVTNMKVT